MPVISKHTVTTTLTHADGTKEVSTASFNVSVASLMDEYVELNFLENPTSCAQFGVRKYEDKFWDISTESIIQGKKNREALLTKVKAFIEEAGSRFSETEATNIALLQETLESYIESIGTPGEEGYALELMHSHMSSPFVTLELAFGQYQRVETEEDLRNYRTRLELVVPQFNHMIEHMRSGIKRGITLNKEGIELLLKKFLASAGPIDGTLEERTAFAQQSALNKVGAARAKELLGDEEYFVPAIRDGIMPGFAAAAKFLQEEYSAHARKNPGLFGLPDYEKQYSILILESTNVRYTADEVHEIGIKEVARIEALLNEAKNACGFSGTLKEFQAAINDKSAYPHLYFDDSEACIADYNAINARAKEAMVANFNKFPKFDCNVMPAPEYLEAQLPLAMYMPGTPEKAGNFVPNMKLHKTKPSHQKTALCLHEANPGHHHQISLQFENNEQHLARRMIFSTAYAEGWGLYCEYLGEEMGFYSDPYQYFGRLELEQFRAIRLVVDSGLHGKGWSHSQAVEYMLSKVSMSREEIETEVKRYCSIPGQALSYKIGEMKIKELRKYAEDTLGEKFDIKEFHATILDEGCVPLGTLEKIVKRWVSKVLGA